MPSTCQDSHLAGKRGASQGSPLRVAPGVPLGVGGDPEPCTERYGQHILLGLDTYVSDAVSSSPIARPGAAMESPAGAGMDSPFNVATELVVSLKTTTLFTVLLAASAILTRSSCSSLMEKKAKLIAPLFCTHILWKSRSANGMCSVDPECTQHSSFTQSETSVLFDLTTKSVKKLVIEPLFGHSEMLGVRGSPADLSSASRTCPC